MGKEAVDALEEKVSVVKQRYHDLNTNEIFDMITLRKQIPAEEWNTFEVPTSLKREYYDILQKVLNFALEERNKKLTHYLLSILPIEDFLEEISEHRINSFIDNYLAREDIDEKQVNILLSAPSLVASHNEYPNSSIALSAVRRDDIVNIALILQRHPNLRQGFIFAYQSEKQYDKLLSFINHYNIEMDAKEIQSETNDVFQMVVMENMRQFCEKGFLTDSQRQTLANGMIYLRWLLNHGGKMLEEHHQSFQEIAKNPEMLKAMPMPNGDSEYSEFYGIINTMSQNHLLSHRADVSGERVIRGIKYDLHGSSSAMMLSQLRTSFARFLTSASAKQAKRQLMNSYLAVLGEERLSTLFEQIAQDIEGIVSYADENEIEGHLQKDQLLLISTLLFFKRNDTLKIAVGFYNDFCFIANSSRSKDPGIEIYHCQGKSRGKQKTKLEVAKILAASEQAKVSSHLTYGRNFNENMSKQLNMTKIALIPLSEQYGENCAWGSAAKMALMIAMYVRFFEAILQLEEVQSLPYDKKMELGHQMAQKQAKILFSMWRHEDKYEFIKEYCDFFEQPHMKGYGPDLLLLCGVYLRAKQRVKDQDIAHLLEVRVKEHLTATNREKTKQRLYKIAALMLKEEMPSFDNFCTYSLSL